jgi:RNA polymerase-binding transcription factor DksA
MTLNTHTYMYAPRPTLDVAATLAQIEAARAAQLESLSVPTDDLVAIAHRDAVSRILTEVQAARRRLVEGLYAVCARCSRAIRGDERLEMLPWATQCPDCDRRDLL